MKKSILALTMAASILALSACSNNNAGDEVIMTSKAGDITKNEFYEELKDVAGEQTFQILAIEKVLENKYKVSDKDVDQAFNREKELYGESFEMYLMQNGQTEESYKKILRINLLQDAAQMDGVEVSDEEVQKRLKEMNTELHARHVLVADEETALKVKEKLEGGADFAEVAKEFSTEPAAQESGGDLGWFGYGKMVPEFWQGAYALEVNKISEPVQSQHGFHIIEVTEKREVEKDKATEEEARKDVALEKAGEDQEALMKKVSKLLKDADIKIKDNDLKDSLEIFMNAGEEKK
ncbi:peptidylprolyl isomerase [Sporosarcina sp. HYO08]|uniref:peptidylprolyl isomerase n=1 Tax=Sporosarcina sp. HYO08 TaxID=1759557 RepID=UPI0007952521|nr:peptidylprolyl isomerase [Sporosarcina sp. HYO08]KXH79296.1 foldase [Sporosarcina sp. HYO08]